MSVSSSGEYLPLQAACRGDGNRRRTDAQEPAAIAAVEQGSANLRTDAEIVVALFHHHYARPVEQMADQAGFRQRG